MASPGISRKAKNTDNGFLTGSVVPALLRFAVPVLFALFLQNFYGAFDLWAVGRFCGSAEVSAVSTGSQTMLIVTGIVAGLSMGSTVLLGMRIGEGDHDGAACVIGTSVLVFGVLGVVLTVITVAAARPIALLMNAPDEAMEHTVNYIRICGAGGVFIAAYNLASAIFRGLGNSRAPLLFVAIASAVNIVGDLVLVGFFRMGAVGAAIATTAAQGVSVILSLVLIRRHGLPFALTRDSIRPNVKTMRRVLLLGAPLALQDMCNEISYLIIIGLVNALGVTMSAGVGIAEKLSMFILLVPVAYMQSVSAFVAQNTGAMQHERARRAMWDGMASAAVIGGAAAALGFFGGGVLSSLFIDDAAVIRVSAEFLKATSIECFVLSIAYCFTGYFNGTGKTRFVMVQGIIAVLAVRVPFAWYMSTRPDPVVFNIGLSETAAAVFVLIVCTAYYAVSSVRRKGRKGI